MLTHDVEAPSTGASTLRTSPPVGWTLAVVALLTVATLLLSDHDGTRVRHGQALSASGAVSVEVDGVDGYLSIPTDVAWLDSAGSYHADGRPECLPPVGIGTIDVAFATVPVEDPQGRREQTVWVDCTGWDPDQLTPQQRANLADEPSEGSE